MKESGFSNAFLFVMLALIILLLWMVIPVGPSERSRRPARIAATRNIISATVNGINKFTADCGSPPSKTQGLKALVLDPGVSGWKGPYVPRSWDFVDPWGTPLAYSLETNGVQILSAGPDCKFGTADDFTNWEASNQITVPLTRGGSTSGETRRKPMKR